ncbi:MAG: WbqC family protein [Syntrophales bacterium]
MHVGMMQPTFLPWLGFFELIYKADVFIFLDDFQFSVQSYHQRNRLFVNKGQVDWYSVPVKKTLSFQMPLNKTHINEDIPWRIKSWKRIQQNYGKARYFKAYEKEISQWLLSPARDLAEQNIAFVKMICEIIGIKRIFLKSSEFASQKQRSERVLELLKWSNAHCYYCAKGSFDYMFEDQKFPVSDIVVLFQNFILRSYPQVGSPDNFVPYLCVLDALFNIGPDDTAELIKGGTVEWRTWEKMVSKKAEELGDEE